MAIGNLKLENYVPVVRLNEGVYTELDIETTGDITGNFVGAVVRPFTTTDADTIAVSASDSGRIYLATKGSATQTFTLPAVAAGLNYTFICGHASGEILINPTGSVVLTIQTFAAVGVDADTAIVTTAAGTGIKNTAATNAISNSVTLVSDGVGWYSTGITAGIWATQ